MANHIVRSLIYITEEGVCAVRELAAKLRASKNTRHVTALLTALVKEASALSAAVEKLGGYVEAVEETSDQRTICPERAREALEAVRLTNALFKNGLCSECSKVLATPSTKTVGLRDAVRFVPIT